MNKYKHKLMPELSNFWVVTMVSNPQRYKSRYELYQRFNHSMQKAGVNLLTVEVALGDRPFELTDPWNMNHVQLRTNSEIWLKENALNIGISRLPPNWETVAWVDSDIEFMRADWAEEVVHQLQHFHVIQCFQTAIDLGPEGEAISTSNGFIYNWMKMDFGERLIKARETAARSSGYEPYPYGLGHSGYAWAARREAITNLGGLMDFPILGASDHSMAWALVGLGAQTNTPKTVTPAYLKHLKIWEERANVHVRQNVGYMPGSLLHHFHGKKALRKYGSRWEILLKHKFDPELDLQRDWQGLYHLSDRGLRMRNDLRAYFRARNEDSQEL